jgi:ceramide glucosyltransferase
VLRLVMAWVVGVWGVGDELVRRKLWLVPLRDAVHFVVWLAGFVSNRVNWGGVEYTIHDGEMEQARSSGPRFPAARV